MLSPQEIVQRAHRKYGEYLKAIVSNNQFFPLKIRFGVSKLASEFGGRKEEIEDLTKGAKKFGYQIDWNEKRTRRWGVLRHPVAVAFVEENCFLKAIGKVDEVYQFKRNFLRTCEEVPEAADWVTTHVFDLLRYSERWNELLKVTDWFRKNPRPGIYMRQIPIEGLSSKFIEEHTGILNQLLSLALPQYTDDREDMFELRHGLRWDLQMVEVRWLGSTTECPWESARTAFPLDVFSAMEPRWRSVIIVENKKSFMALRSIPGCLAIFGQGMAAISLAAVPWFHHCDAIYWGDMDTWGFEILNSLRESVPSLRSICMDEVTFNSFESLLIPAKPHRWIELKQLSEAETEAYRHVRTLGVLLEQEKIPVSVAEAAIVS